MPGKITRLQDTSREGRNTALPLPCCVFCDALVRHIFVLHNGVGSNPVRCERKIARGTPDNLKGLAGHTQKLRAEKLATMGVSSLKTLFYLAPFAVICS